MALEESRGEAGLALEIRNKVTKSGLSCEQSGGQSGLSCEQRGGQSGLIKEQRRRQFCLSSEQTGGHLSGQ